MHVNSKEWVEELLNAYGLSSKSKSKVTPYYRQLGGNIPLLSPAIILPPQVNCFYMCTMIMIADIVAGADLNFEDFAVYCPQLSALVDSTLNAFPIPELQVSNASVPNFDFRIPYIFPGLILAPDPTSQNTALFLQGWKIHIL